MLLTFRRGIRLVLPSIRVFFNLPNTLSHLRIVAIWPIYLLLNNGSSWALKLYLIALLTDFLDGKAALWFNQKTPFGKLWDPLADKLLHLGLLGIFSNRITELTVSFNVVMAFAILLAGLPGLTNLFKIKRPMGANLAGKLKMTAEAFAIVCLFQGQTVAAIAILWWLAIPLAVISIYLHLVLKKEFSALDYITRHSRFMDWIYRRLHGHTKT